MSELEELSLSELHAIAAELAVPRYRLLRREELVSELRSRGTGAPGAPAEPLQAAEHPAPPPAPGPEEEPEAEPEEPARPKEAGEPVSGILEVMPQRFGFLRLQGLVPAEGDVYISASQIRRCELRPGDEVYGPARDPRRGERHRALVHVEAVNGAEPGTERPEFEELTPVAAKRRLPIGAVPDGEAQLLLRAVDLLAPLAFGQRVLVSAAPRSGRTTLLRALARSISAGGAGELIVLLIDERPEEATRWRDELPGAQLAIATAESSPAEEARIAELALSRARRLAESGTDVVLLVDSLSRLAAARGDAAPTKRLFGSGRELAEEGAGSLTVVATVLADDDDPAASAVATTENALIRLDPQLAAAGIFPALDPARCRVSDEGELREPEELAAVRNLRGLLAGLPPREAAGMLRERLEATQDNAELLRSLAGAA